MPHRQNVTGQNVTGQNVTGQNFIGQEVTGEDVTKGRALFVFPPSPKDQCLD